MLAVRAGVLTGAHHWLGNCCGLMPTVCIWRVSQSLYVDASEVFPLFSFSVSSGRNPHSRFSAEEFSQLPNSFTCMPLVEYFPQGDTVLRTGYPLSPSPTHIRDVLNIHDLPQRFPQRSLFPSVLLQSK